MTESYLALYRKYRPDTFSDVVGQEQIVTLLQNSIKQKKIAHAYLFCGGRGTGKTTVARIFARDIGCNPEDIIEIDAASNRGIDEIRELREAVRTAPFSSPYKVYIVDEAHMLTKEAANALLKTLEEPPSHVIFILATTDPDKLPKTIVSRCQKVIFKQPDIELLSKRIEHIATEEGFSLSEGAAEEIAKHGKGSYRDALGVLEHILITSGNKITKESVFVRLGTPDEQLLSAILYFVCQGKKEDIIQKIELLKERNNSAIRSYDAFLEHVKTALLVRVTGLNTSDPVIQQAVKEYPHVIASKTVLELLEKRHLLEVSENHAWTAFTAILLSLIEA